MKVFSVCIALLMPLLAVSQDDTKMLFDVKKETLVLADIPSRDLAAYPVALASFEKIRGWKNASILLPGDFKPLHVAFSRLQPRGENGYLLKGSFGPEEGEVFIVREGDLVFGSLRYQDRAFDIRTLSGRVVLIEKEPLALPEGFCGSKETPGFPKQVPVSDVLKKETLIGFPDVKVLVLYNTGAQNAISSIGQSAALAIEQLNDACYNSNITQGELKFTLIGTRKIEFTEDIRIEVALNDITSNEEANSYRDSYAADIVIMVTDRFYNGPVGAAYVGPNNSQAYGIVDVHFLNEFEVFSHEVGHIMGLRHQQCYQYNSPNCDDTPGPAHGHGFKTGWLIFTKKRSTIMYEQEEGRTRERHFSNPYVLINNTPTGDLEANYSASVLRSNAATVASFRTGTQDMNAFINAPGTASNGQIIQMQAVVSNGAAPISYRWELSEDGSTYTYAGNTEALYQAMPLRENLHIKLTVWDGIGAQKTVKHLVVNTTDSDGPCTSCPDHPPVDEENEPFEISLSPTLVGSFLNIKLLTKVSGSLTWAIRLPSGELVAQGIVPAQELIILPVASLERGYYVISLTSQEGFTASAGFIKQ